MGPIALLWTINIAYLCLSLGYKSEPVKDVF